MVGAGGADRDAGGAVDALGGVEQQFPSGCDALRIVTPWTVQRTALEEYRCPDARTVVQLEALDVEDKACRNRCARQNGFARGNRFACWGNCCVLSCHRCLSGDVIAAIFGIDVMRACAHQAGITTQREEGPKASARADSGRD